MKKTSVGVVIVSLSLAASYHWISKRSSPSPLQQTEIAEALQSGAANPDSSQSLTAVFKQLSPLPAHVSSEGTYGAVQADVKETIQRRFSPEEKSRAEAYFNRIVSDPNTRVLYERAQELLGPSQAGQGAARWVTLGVVFSSSDGYRDSLHLALKDANSDPQAVLATLRQQAPALRKDPFLYQMAMNLNYQLNLDASLRGTFFGEEFEHQLKSASAGSEPGDAFWVSLLGLTLARQADVPASVLAPYIRQGLSAFNGSPRLRDEIQQTIGFHFPELAMK